MAAKKIYELKLDDLFTYDSRRWRIVEVTRLGAMAVKLSADLKEVGYFKRFNNKTKVEV